MIDNVTFSFNEQDGLTFKHVCTWEPMSLSRMFVDLSKYHIAGAFEENGELFFLMTNYGLYKLIRITTHDGYHEINSMELLSVEARQILKRYVYDERGLPV